jgi:uncharacterized protein with PIN domain
MKKLIFILLVCTAVSTSVTLITFGNPRHSVSKGNESTLFNDLQQKKDTTLKVVYTCPMHPEVIQDAPGKCPKCKMNLVKKEVAGVVYTCPMHPEVKQDKPGKCPKCKMDLVKKTMAKK